MLSEQRLKTFEEEIKGFNKLLGKAASTIVEKDVSEYPIFILHHQQIEIGLPLHQATTPTQWSINASTLEEFVTKQLIEMDKIESFKSAYRDPQLFLCLFVIEKEGATFVFIPRN